MRYVFLSPSSSTLFYPFTTNPHPRHLQGDDEREQLEIAAMKARVAEMEQEAALLRQFSAVATAEADATIVPMSDDEREAVDSRSIYVGNVSVSSSLDRLR